jgi:ferrochelatase
MGMPTYLGDPSHQHGAADRLGVLLVNLGTPDGPEPGPVRRFLADFLGDPRVIEAPRLLWWLALHGVILRIRPSKSAHAYRQIWTPQGSPLLTYSTALTQRVAEALAPRWNAAVALGMTYGSPSIPRAIEDLRRQGTRQLVVLPLYPQYSGSTTASVFERVTKELGLAQVQADKKMPAKEKKEVLADLNEALKSPPPAIENKGNIDLVEKYYDKLAEALGEGEE